MLHENYRLVCFGGRDFSRISHFGSSFPADSVNEDSATFNFVEVGTKIRESVSKEEAEDVKAKLEEAGAEAELV